MVTPKARFDGRAFVPEREQRVEDLLANNREWDAHSRFDCAGGERLL